MPTAMIVTSAVCRPMFRKFAVEKKTGEATAKMITSAISTSVIR